MKYLFAIAFLAFGCTRSYPVQLKDGRRIEVDDDCGCLPLHPGDNVAVRSYPLDDHQQWYFVKYVTKDTTVYDTDGFPVEWRHGIILNQSK